MSSLSRVALLGYLGLILASLFTVHGAGGSTGNNAVTTLLDHNFDSIVGSTNQIWIIEFYAPWCGHCQKLLPKFDEAAIQEANLAKTANRLPVRFGSVNCDDAPKLKQKYSVEGFPTILYFTPPEGSGPAAKGLKTNIAPAAAKEYNGPRTTEALVDVAIRLSRAPVMKLPYKQDNFDINTWSSQYGRDGISFVYVEGSIPHAEETEINKSFRKSFRQVARLLRDSFTFAVVREEDIRTVPNLQQYITNPPPTPYIIRVESSLSNIQYIVPDDLGKLKYSISLPVNKRARESSASTSNTIVDESANEDDTASKTTETRSTLESLYSWVQHLRWPSVIALGPDNFPHVANNPEGRFLVIAAVHANELNSKSNGDDTSTTPSRSSAVYAAVHRMANPKSSLLSSEIRDRFLFTWLDAKTFEAFLDQFNIEATEAPHLIVLDAPNKSFWVDNSVDEEDEMETWLSDIINGRAPMQRQGILAVPQQMYNMFGFWGTGIIATVIALSFLYFVYILVIAEACGWNEEKRKSTGLASPPGSSRGSSGTSSSATNNNRTPPSSPNSLRQRK